MSKFKVENTDLEGNGWRVGGGRNTGAFERQGNCDVGRLQYRDAFCSEGAVRDIPNRRWLCKDNVPGSWTGFQIKSVTTWWYTTRVLSALYAAVIDNDDIRECGLINVSSWPWKPVTNVMNTWRDSRDCHVHLEEVWWCILVIANKHWFRSKTNSICLECKRDIIAWRRELVGERDVLVDPETGVFGCLNKTDVTKCPMEPSAGAVTCWVCGAQGKAAASILTRIGPTNLDSCWKENQKYELNLTAQQRYKTFSCIFCLLFRFNTNTPSRKTERTWWGKILIKALNSQDVNVFFFYEFLSLFYKIFL